VTDQHLQLEAATPGPARLELEHVTLAYGEQIAVDDVSCHIGHGARVAVVGPNGAGKSTLFKALVGLLPLRHGRVTVHGRPLGHQAGPVAYVPQRKEIDWDFPVTVGDVVMMGRYGRLGWLRRPAEGDRAVVTRCLEQMGLAGLANRPISDLSGGQQQRVFLARALAQEPHILLLDEPFTGVDISTQEAMLGLLDQLRAQEVTVLISTHDLGLAASRFDRILLLNRRLIAYGSAPEVFTPQALSEAFGRQMFVLPGGAVAIDHCCPPGQERPGAAR